MRRRLVASILLIALRFVVPSIWADTLPKPADDEPSDVATVWFDTLYEMVKSEATAFPEVPQIYGTSAVSLYEAIVPGTPLNRSLVDQLDRLTSVPQPKAYLKYPWPTVANAARARTIHGIVVLLKPESLKAINALEQRFADRFQAEVEAQAYPQQPCWGQLRPMVPTSNEECTPPGHPKFSTNPKSAFYADALEVYDTGLALTDEQRAIAQYWADGVGATGTSSGHWMAVVGQIARNESLSLAAGGAYAKCGIAVVDAFITIFHAKYVYNLQHPLTYIQNHIDKIWLPYLVHPPDPLYSSRHSIQSRAAAEVLTDLFGHKAFTDTLQTDYNLMPPPRTARVQLV